MVLDFSQNNIFVVFEITESNNVALRHFSAHAMADEDKNANRCLASDIRSWKTITNISDDNIGLGYLPSFSYTGLCEDNLKLFIPHNSWCNEVDWKQFTTSQLGMKKYAVLHRIQ